MESTLLEKKMAASFALEDEDLLQNILSRLPAVSFASGSCVCKSWNKACHRILCRPKLASALSLSSSLQVAVKEVLDKVLSEPIRPHFAIAWGLNFDLVATHRLITQKLGSRIPIITNEAPGIIGMDAHTNEIIEAKWKFLRQDARNVGIILVVGFVPGLKVSTIPLLRTVKDGRFPLKSREPEVEAIDKFLMDIKEYTASVSNCSSPEGIIMFGGLCIDLEPVLVQMDNSMAKETVIVGGPSGNFLFKSGDDPRNHIRNANAFNAVALVFAKDNSSPSVRGKIQFHVTLSSGMLPFGPKLTVASVSVKKENWSVLTARMEGHPDILDSWVLLEDIFEAIEDENPNLYIGVMHETVGSQRLRSRSHVTFYLVTGEAPEHCFAVYGVGIKPGDSFLFYHTDSETASSSSTNAHQDLEILKTAASTSHDSTINYDHKKKEIIGGLIFSSSPRGLSFPHVIESLPFSATYPGTPLAGVFCSGEIARVSTSLITLHDDEVDDDDDDDDDDDNEESSNSGGCYLHHFSTVYLVMSYTPPLQH